MKRKFKVKDLTTFSGHGLGLTCANALFVFVATIEPLKVAEHSLGSL